MAADTKTGWLSHSRGNTMRRFVWLMCLAIPSLASAYDLTLEQIVKETKPPRHEDEAVRFRMTLQIKGDWGRAVTRSLPKGNENQDREEASSKEAATDKAEADGGQEILIDFKRQIVYEIDRQLKTYYESSYAAGKFIDDERAKLIQELRDGRRKAHYIAAYDGTDPTREALIRDHLKPGPFRTKMMKKYNISETRVVYKVEPIEQTEKIIGYTCRRLVVTANGTPTIDEAWVTTELEVKANIFDFLAKTKLIDADLVEAMRKIKGIPLRYAVRLDDGAIHRTVTTSVSKETLDKKLFRHPKKQGLRRQKEKKSSVN